MPSPNVGALDNHLLGVAAISSSDAWAVGYYFNGSIYQTMTLRWNGSVWSVVSSPNAGTASNFVTGVTAISATDVWLVGYYLSPSFEYLTLTMHWDGDEWSIVSSPSTGTDGSFPGPITVVFRRLPPGVRAVKPTGYTASGDPYVTIDSTSLSQGDAVRGQFAVLFHLRNPRFRPLANLLILRSVRVFAGPFDPLAV